PAPAEPTLGDAVTTGSADRSAPGASPTAERTDPTGRARLLRYFEPHRGGRFSSLDGYRAVAAIGVLVFHVGGAATSDV
ncbi:hypothetical protein, partial [Salmonella sp. SAL4442]|uniref:hypothetical protein n=1 Tax=Salmonella sp. SAL4442 TaxID=3159897 RepID=UPI00397D6BCF